MPCLIVLIKTSGILRLSVWRNYLPCWHLNSSGHGLVVLLIKTCNEANNWND